MECRERVNYNYGLDVRKNGLDGRSERCYERTQSSQVQFKQGKLHLTTNLGKHTISSVFRISRWKYTNSRSRVNESRMNWLLRLVNCE